MSLPPRTHHLIVRANVSTPHCLVVAKGLIISTYFVVGISWSICRQICFITSFATYEQTVTRKTSLLCFRNAFRELTALRAVLILIWSCVVLHKVAQIVRKLDVLASGVIAIGVVNEELIVSLEDCVEAQTITDILTASIFVTDENIISLWTATIVSQFNLYVN